MLTISMNRSVSLVKLCGQQVTRTKATVAAVQSSHANKYHFDTNRYGKHLVLVEGVRTPFAMSLTDYANLWSYELQAMALRALMARVHIDPHLIDYVICGTNLHEPSTPNVAREAVLAAGLPDAIPAHTVTMACVSANQAVTGAMALINSGTVEVAIAGGVETASDVPIRHSRKMRRIMLELNKAKTGKQRLAALKQLRPQHLMPEIPGIAEFFTDETMGHSSDRMSAAFEVSRREQDEFGLRSHSLAEQAFKAGYLSDLSPVFVSGKGLISRDNGIKVSTLDKVSRLKPAFTKPYGTATAANSSYLTDGATACLITTEARAKELGLKPKAYLRQHLYVAQDLQDQTLLGPAYATARLLARLGLRVSDIDVWEWHEAFAGQVLANLKALDSDYFCRTYLGQSGKVGAPDLAKFNAWGGSLSIGHPFGATGVRLITTAANRLIKENGHLAYVSACAGGGIGVGMILQRYPQ